MTYLKSLMTLPTGEFEPITCEQHEDDTAFIDDHEEVTHPVQFASSSAIQFAPTNTRRILTGKEIDMILGATAENPLLTLDWRAVNGDGSIIQIIGGFHKLPTNPNVKLKIDGMRLYYRRIMRGTTSVIPNVTLSDTHAAVNNVIRNAPRESPLLRMLLQRVD